MTMEIQIIEGTFSVCKLRDTLSIPADREFYFTAKTDEEFSLVCRTQDAPDQFLAREDGWRAFRIQGQLDFSLIGILSRLSTLLAEKGIGIFAISTYNTDYILTREENFYRAIQALGEAGYTLVP